MANLSAGNYVPSSVSQNIAKNPASLVGIFVSAATGATMQVFDDGSTGTNTPIIQSFVPVAATWYPMPFQTNRGINCVVGGTITYTVAYD